ncbi:MAG: isoprenylcysteine carboxylmethyltransferase family protein [Candidatus Desantisbacteria bacterium]
MPLYEEFVDAGSFLFRWRSYLPLVVFGIIFSCMTEFNYLGGTHTLNLIWEMVCLSVSFFGLFIRCYTIGHTPENTSGRNTTSQIADQLNIDGIYSVTRNPLYLGNFFMMLGVIMFPHVWWVGLIYVLSFWLYYERIIFAEEDFLRKKFGQEYEDWAKQTHAFWPDFKHWRKHALPFSLRNVLKREYSGFFGVISSFMVLELIADYIIYGSFVIDWIWTSIFICSLVIYLTLRTLKKKTRLLHVEGR